MIVCPKCNARWPTVQQRGVSGGYDTVTFYWECHKCWHRWEETEKIKNDNSLSSLPITPPRSED